MNDNINPDKLKQLKSQRHRVLLFIRLKEGIRQLIAYPVKSIAFVPLLILGSTIFSNSNYFLSVENFLPAFLIKPYEYALITLFTLFFLLLFVGLVTLIGIPFRANWVEIRIMYAFTINDVKSDFYPTLISRKRIPHTDITVSEFYSLGIGKSVWELHKQDIADILEAHFVTPQIILGGRKNNNSNRIIIFTAPGAVPKERGELIDDELYQ